MEELFYWYKPYILYTLSFLAAQLDHPIKWIPVALLLTASLYISYARFCYNSQKFDKIEVVGLTYAD